MFCCYLASTKPRSKSCRGHGLWLFKCEISGGAVLSGFCWFCGYLKYPMSYPLVNVYKQLKMAIEIVDFPIKNADVPWQNVSSPEGNSWFSYFQVLGKWVESIAFSILVDGVRSRKCPDFGDLWENQQEESRISILYIKWWLFDLHKQGLKTEKWEPNFDSPE